MRPSVTFSVQINNRQPEYFACYYEALDYAEFWGVIVKAVAV